jgi:hypothetical protein
MKFVLGFISASLLWGAVAGLYVAGIIGKEPAPVESAEPNDAPSDEREKPETSKKRRRPRKAGSKDPSGRAAGASETGDDDIGWDDARGIDMNAGEQQLSGVQIEKGFDSVMPRIRRCLILVPADGEIQGRLSFGMRVGADGKVRAVNLSGPSVVTGGESGGCLRDTARGIQFAPFDGPDMVFKYPIELQ